MNHVANYVVHSVMHCLGLNVSLSKGWAHLKVYHAMNRVNIGVLVTIEKIAAALES